MKYCRLFLYVVFLCLLLVFLPFHASAFDFTFSPGNTTFSVNIPEASGTLILTGYTSPGSLVTFVNNGVVIGTTLAGPAGLDEGGNPLPRGEFQKKFNGMLPGNMKIGTFSTDSKGKTTPTITRDVAIFVNQTTSFDPILLPPTLEVLKVPLKRPEVQKVEGFAYTNSTVVLYFEDLRNFISVTSDINGYWTADVPDTFHLGNKKVDTIVQNENGAISERAQSSNFDVLLSADLNIDSQVDLTDFSMLMFNFERDPYTNISADINDDGPIDLVDFSIMMFYWTD